MSFCARLMRRLIMVPAEGVPARENPEGAEARDSWTCIARDIDGIARTFPRSDKMQIADKITMMLKLED